MNREVRAFGQILSDKSVGVFIAAALPRRMRVGKIINRQVQIGGDLFVQRHFLAAIIGQGFAQEFRHRFHLADEALMNDRSGCVIELNKDDVARRALDQCADG